MFDAAETKAKFRVHFMARICVSTTTPPTVEDTVSDTDFCAVLRRAFLARRAPTSTHVQDGRVEAEAKSAASRALVVFP